MKVTYWRAEMVALQLLEKQKPGCFLGSQILFDTTPPSPDLFARNHCSSLGLRLGQRQLGLLDLRGEGTKVIQEKRDADYGR
jgi:hypothetical protein